MWARISRSIARWYFFRFVHWFWLCMCSGISKSCENPTSNTLWTAVTVTIGYSDTDTSYGVKYAVECVKVKGSSSHFPIPNKSFIAVWCTRRQKTSSKECLTNLVWLIQICIFHSFLSYSLKKKINGTGKEKCHNHSVLVASPSHECNPHCHVEAEVIL